MTRICKRKSGLEIKVVSSALNLLRDLNETAKLKCQEAVGNLEPTFGEQFMHQYK